MKICLRRICFSIFQNCFFYKKKLSIINCIFAGYMKKNFAFLIFLAVFIMACGSENGGYRVVLYDTAELRNGDLLFRNGIGYESHVVTGVSHGEYSHVGLAYHDGTCWRVIHAVPGENEKGKPELLKCEPLSAFYRFDRAQSGGAARVGCSDSVANAATLYALDCVNRNMLFDNDYDLNDSSKLYCTELVWLAFLAQDIDITDGSRHIMPIINAGAEVIFPDDIWKSSAITNRLSFETETNANTN